MTPRFPTPRTLGALIALLMLALVPLAAAQMVDGRAQVNGAGLVTVDGRVAMIGAAHARRGATVKVVDRAGDALVSFNGLPVTPRVLKGRQEFKLRQNGRFLISGSRVTIEVQGDTLDLSVAGVGGLRTRGRGTLSVDGAPAQAWSSQYVKLGGMARPAIAKRRANNRATRG